MDDPTTEIPEDVATSSPEANGDERLEALRSLTPPEKVALTKVARYYSRGGLYEHEELLNECFVRYLDGRRSQPPSVPLVPFLAGVMRSIAFEWRKAECADNCGDACEGISVPADVDAHLELAKIARAFGSDNTGRMVFLGLVHGLSREQIQAVAKLTPTQFDTTKRRVQRLVRKLYGDEEDA